MASQATEHLIDLDRKTGDLVQGWDRIKQSIEVILTTRVGTRLMRRWWGSSFLNMQDKPGSEEVIMSGMMAAIAAINTYEPEFKISKVSIDEMNSDGEILITIDGVDIVDRALKRSTVSITR